MQTSSKKLTPKLKKQISDQFYTLLADIKNKQEIENFLKIFLSDTERLVFAKRLHIAKLIHQGKSYSQIKKQLRVSSATISSISETIDKPEIQWVLGKIAVEDWAEKITNKIFKLLKK